MNLVINEDLYYDTLRGEVEHCSISESGSHIKSLIYDSICTHCSRLAFILNVSCNSVFLYCVSDTPAYLNYL